jgi:hypothetical protein
MQLPGGLWDGQQRRRDFAFGPITGAFEVTLAETASAGTSLPRRVTIVLSNALEHLGGVQATTERVHQLAVGDRQFLVRQLAALIDQDILWLSSTCTCCRRGFDVQIEQSRLPVKEAGTSFPFAIAPASWGDCRLRIPSGEDQDAAAQITDDRAATRLLARRCALDPIPETIRELSEADVARIEHAVEHAAPEVTTIVQCACPECGHANEVYVDPYVCLTTSVGSLWDDVHEVASAYHWSERDILALSRARRQTYLRRIARGRGSSGDWTDEESVN